MLLLYYSYRAIAMVTHWPSLRLVKSKEGSRIMLHLSTEMQRLYSGVLKIDTEYFKQLIGLPISSNNGKITT